MATSVYSVEDVEYAPINEDGTLPTAGWKKLGPIADDAVTLTIPQMATTDIRAQNVAGIYEVLPGDTDPVEMVANGLDVNGEIAAEISGGAWDSPTKRFDAPATPVIKDFAWRITSQPLNGVKARFFIRKAATFFNPTLSFVRNDLVKMTFTARSKTPLNASGVAQSPWGFQIIPGTQTT